MTAEYLRYILIVGGLFVLGFNCAVIVHAAEIVRAVRAWRLFLVGKSLMTIFVVIALYDNLHSREIGWRIPLALSAIFLTLVSLVMLDHSYRRSRNDLGPVPANQERPR